VLQVPHRRCEVVMNAEAEDEYLRMVAGGDILPVGADFPDPLGFD